MRKKKIHTFECYQTFTPTDDYENFYNSVKQLNLHYFNDKNCNHYVDGKYVAKYPEIEEKHPEIRDAHYNVRRGQIYKIVVDLYSDGSYKIRPKK